MQRKIIPFYTGGLSRSETGGLWRWNEASVFPVWIFILIPLSISASYEYAYEELLGYCDSYYHLHCPSQTSSRDRAGTLVYENNKSCTFNLTLSSCEQDLAVYFNVREFSSLHNSTLEIYERLHGSQFTLLKRLSAPELASGTTSIGQFRTRFSRDISLQFRTTFPMGHPVITPDRTVLDFTSLSETRNSIDTARCDSLNGFMPLDLRCDKTDQRINCPTVFHADPEGNNHAQGSLSYANCPTDDSGLSGDAIFGIAAASLFVVLFLLAAICACKMKRSRKSTTSTRNRQGEQGIPLPLRQPNSGNRSAHPALPAATGLTANFIGSPPSYEELFSSDATQDARALARSQSDTSDPCVNNDPENQISR